MTVLITKLSIKSPPMVRPNGTKILADFEFAARGIRISHCKIVLNAEGYLVVWYPSIRNDANVSVRTVSIDDRDLHRDITAAARAGYAAMGGTIGSPAKRTNDEAANASVNLARASDPDDDEAGELPAFLTTPTPLPIGEAEHG